MAVNGNLWGGLHTRKGAQVHGSGIIVFALRFVLLAQLDALVDPPYTQLVVTRYDQYHACPLAPVRAAADELLAPEGEDYGGVADRFLVFAFSARHRVLALLPCSPGCKPRRTLCL